MRIILFLLTCTLWAPMSANTQPLQGKVGVYSLPDSVWWDQWIEFQSNIMAQPDDCEFEWYLLGELGSEQPLITGARRNRIQIISISSQGMTSLVPEMGVMLAPHMFESAEETDFVLDNYLAEPIGALFRNLGLEIIQFTEVGWMVLYTVDKPVLEPTDLTGLTIRISPTIILQSFVESLGANYAVIELGELIPGLQTGLVNGGLTNVVFVHNALEGQVCCVTRLRNMREIGVKRSALSILDRPGTWKRRYSTMVDAQPQPWRGRSEASQHLEEKLRF